MTLLYKKVSALLKGVTSKYRGHLYCQNCLQYFPTENKSDPKENLCNCLCLLESINGCINNPENSTTDKVSDHIP